MHYMKHVNNTLHQLYHLAKDTSETDFLNKAGGLLCQFSNEQNHAMINAIGEGIFGIDTNGNIVFINPAAKQLLGIKHDQEVLGKNAHDLFHHHHANGTEYELSTCPNYQTLITQQTREEQEDTFWRTDGTPIAVCNLSYPLFSEDGVCTGAVVHFRDITQEKKRTEALKLSASVFDNASEGIMIAGPDKRIKQVNPAFSLITGYQPEEVIGQNPAMLASGLHDAEFYQRMWHDIKHHGRWQGEIINRRADGEPLAEWLTISAVMNDTQEVTHYVAIFRDITEHKEQQSTIAHMALHDALTGLPNRNSLARAFPKLAALCHRNSSMMALMFLDLDRFKWVNDSLGHDIGDRLLIAITQRLKNRLRESDFIARLGGDEFVILLPDITNARMAAQVAHDLLAELTPEFSIEHHLLSASFSIGVSIFPHDSKEFNVLMRNADNAMYHAKADGRNTFRFFNRSMDEEAQKRLSIETALRQAIQNNELSLVYQPQTDITGKVIAAEALIRWQHPTLGSISPELFIPIAEENSQIRILGNWVIETACQQLAAWNAEGLTLEKLAINVSLIQLHDTSFIQHVKQTMRKYHIPAQQIMLEFTETKLAQEVTSLQTQLAQIRQAGIGIAIDDFGTGYSNMGQLKQLKVDQIKIDRSFIQDALDNPEDQAIINAIIQMARALNISTLAEGVETDQQWQLMQDLQVDQLQGFHFYRPLNVDAMRQLLVSR